MSAYIKHYQYLFISLNLVTDLHLYWQNIYDIIIPVIKLYMVNKTLKTTYHPRHHLEEQQCTLRTADQHHRAKLSNNENNETTNACEFQSEICLDQG